MSDFPTTRAARGPLPQRGSSTACVLCVVALSLLAARAEEGGRSERAQPALATGQGGGPAAATRASEGEIRNLIARLDAPRFDAREQATRELVVAGTSAVPYLVDALGQISCEVRLRARLLLCQHHSFEEVAPHLVDAVEKPYALSARELLREHVLWQIDVACQPPCADKLFKFWGTDIDAYRDRVLIRLADAKTRAETAQAVEPLLGLCAKTARFSAAASRLDALSLAYDHQHSPAFVVAQTLARGLAENHAGWVAFAEQHVAALGKLVDELQRQNTPTHAIRKELSDRANMSQGAARFLVDVLDETSRQRAVLTQRIGISPQVLTDAFCRGLASTDSAEYDRGVGRVHIADMLTESLGKWPDAPHDGVVQQLITSTAQTVNDGDKPKALAFLDALDACRELSKHRLDVRAGLGQQLGERLYRAAVESPNNRVYNPARRVHDKIVALTDMGIAPEHEAFPRRLLEDYLRGVAEATSDEQRLALERYLRILERLQAAGLGFEQPGSKRFALAMRDCLTTRHDRLAAGVVQLEQIVAAQPTPGGNMDAAKLDHSLGEWVSQLTTKIDGHAGVAAGSER